MRKAMWTWERRKEKGEIAVRTARSDRKEKDHAGQQSFISQHLSFTRTLFTCLLQIQFIY